MFKRLLDLEKLSSRKSLFLFGSRMTGKSTLVKQELLSPALVLDLLKPSNFLELSANPQLFTEQVRYALGRSASRKIVVDEIQKLPILLDEIHRLQEEDKSLRFVLTGSSARKLRSKGVNLLGGRASVAYLHPIVFPELASFEEDPSRYDFEACIQWGGLPAVLTSTHRKEDLLDYVGVYLQEEIKAEGLARNVRDFSRFLRTAALANGEQVNFSEVARDTEVGLRDVREYFSILTDTLVGHLLPAFRKTRKRKAMAMPKFFFFDVGVANALLGRWSLQRGTPEYGRAFEHYLFCELKAAIDYRRSEAVLSYWRSLSQLEVDFVLELPGKAYVAVEVKATERVLPKHLKALLALDDDLPKARKIVVCLEERGRLTADGIEIIPIREFLRDLWSGKILR